MILRLKHITNPYIQNIVKIKDVEKRNGIGQTEQNESGK